MYIDRMYDSLNHVRIEVEPALCHTSEDLQAQWHRSDVERLNGNLVVSITSL